MYLGEAEEHSELVSEALDQALIRAKWDHFPASSLSHHNQACCELAREWLCSMDFAQLNGAGLLSGPRWLRESYEWGPSAWPLHWCEAVAAKVIDCGAHAALANEVFDARGVTSFRAQFVQQYNSQAIEQWRTTWDEQNVSNHWLGRDSIYHEGNALLIAENEVKLWDGSAACWINPVQTGGYGSLLSLRIFAPPNWTGRDSVQWGAKHISLNEWNHIGGRPADRAAGTSFLG